MSSASWWRRGPLRRVMADYGVEHRVSYAVGTLMLLLTNYVTVRIPLEIGASVDALSAGQLVGRHAATIAGMGALIIAVRALSRILFFNPGRDIEYKIRRNLFARLMRLQPSFYAGQRTGDLVSRASSDITQARALIGFGGLGVVNVTLAVTLTGWKMIALSPRLTFFGLVPVAVALALVQRGVSRLFLLQRQNQEQLGAISDLTLSSFQGIATIQNFVAEDAFLARFRARNKVWFETGMRLSVVRSVYFPMLPLAGGLGTFALLWVGGPMALDRTLTVGDLAAFTSLLATLLPPLRGLGWLVSLVQRGQASLDRIFEMIDAPVDRPEGEHGLVPPAGHAPTIQIRDLCFAFPDDPDRRVLSHLSVDVPAGAVVGMFGRTGSGRTTLLRLLARLYNPPRGTILVDGADILDLDLDAWRQRLAVVPQRPFLFSDAIAENVALEAPSEGEDWLPRLHEVMARAALTADLEVLPQGLQTVVGERGILLSGGQRQRVALARGLYRDPDMVLLDDVLSAVDQETEQRLIEALRAVSSGGHRPTTFIVSHRLSALRHADLILVFDKGQVVEQGTHAELIGRPGLYRESWLLWREDGAEAEQVEVAS